ncbi:MAG TPA: acyl-CoA thioesterase [Actinomycetes bacterium]|nr:acyl-CoA thioesterase [Actinomycetes bacterium]
MKQVDIRVRWADMDAYQHVNNAVYLNYFEEARDQVMVDMFGPEALDFVLAHVDIDFRNELTQDDGTISVFSRVTGYGRSSVRSREVVRKADGTLSAEGGAVVVPRDPSTGSSRPLTSDEIARIEAALDADRAAGHDF